jgi:hypothetical protein
MEDSTIDKIFILNCQGFGLIVSLTANPDLTGFQNLSGLQDGKTACFLAGVVGVMTTDHRLSYVLGLFIQADPALAEGVFDQFGFIGQGQLVHRIGPMRFNGFDADAQQLSNFLVRLSFGQ